jgi:hypothetical protein
MTTGMLVFRGVAAQHFATGLTNSEMHPSIVNPNAFLTAEHRVVGFWNQVFQRHFIQMLARHKFFSVDELKMFFA